MKGIESVLILHTVRQEAAQALADSGLLLNDPENGRFFTPHMSPSKT